MTESDDALYWRNLQNAGQRVIRTLMIIGGFSVAFVAIGGGLFALFIPEQTRLSFEYDVPAENVFVHQKPHGCDFADAPLGSKHCHYEKHVELERACRDCKVTRVDVSWDKVEE